MGSEFLITEIISFAVDFAQNLMVIGVQDAGVMEAAHAISKGVNELHPDQPGSWRLGEVAKGIEQLLISLGGVVEHALFNAVRDTMAQLVHNRVILPDNATRLLGSTR